MAEADAFASAKLRQTLTFQWKVFYQATFSKEFYKGCDADARLKADYHKGCEQNCKTVNRAEAQFLLLLLLKTLPLLSFRCMCVRVREL